MPLPPEVAKGTRVFPEKSYQKMRGMSYQEVVQTHGQISFPEVLRKEKAL